jgi:hypothetical protein
MSRAPVRSSQDDVPLGKCSRTRLFEQTNSAQKPCRHIRLSKDLCRP